MDTLDSPVGETQNDTNAIAAPEEMPPTYIQESSYQPFILETLPRTKVVTGDVDDPARVPPSTNQVVRNIAIQSLSKMAGYAITLISVIRLLALFQNATNYGPYSNMMNYLAVFAFIADGGLLLIGIREASRAPQNVAKIISTALVLKTFLGMLSFGSAILLIYLVFPNTAPYTADVKLSIVILAVTMFFTSLSNTFDILFLSRQQPQTMALTELISRIIMFVGIIGLSLYQVQASSADRLPLRVIFFSIVGLNVIINFLPFLIKLAVTLRQIHLQLNLDWSYARLLFLTSLPMGIVSILAQLYYKADSLMLSFPALDKAASYNVGVYNAAYKVTDPVNIFLQLFTSLLFPMLAAYSVGNITRFRDVANRSVDILLVIIIPVSTGLCVLATGIVAIIASSYPQSALPEAILGISMTFSILSSFYSYIVIAQNQQTTLVPILLVNIIANIAMNLYAIPHYGYVGTAIVTVISEALNLGLTMYVTSRLLTILPSFRGIIRPLIAGGAMASVLLVLYHSSVVLHTIPGTIILITVGAVVYGVMIYSLNGIDPAILRLIAQRFPPVAILPGFTARTIVRVRDTTPSARVSIIITTRNQVHTVREALQSALDQTVQAHEIIVIDVDSFDNTEAVVSRFPHVAYRRLVNSSITQARAFGATLVTGDWLCFLDAADSLEPIAIERWLTMAKRAPQSGLIFGQTIVRDEEHHIAHTFKPHITHPHGQLDGLTEAVNLINRDYIPLGSYMINRATWSIVGGFTQSADDDLDAAEFSVRALLATTAAYISQPILNVRTPATTGKQSKLDPRVYERQQHIGELLLRDPRLNQKQRHKIRAILAKRRTDPSKVK